MKDPCWPLLQKWQMGSGARMLKRAVLQKAGHPMAFTDFHEIGFMNTAHRFCRDASRVKPASGWRIDSTWDLSFRNGMGSPVPGIRYWHSGQERSRIGMSWVFEDFLQGTDFNDLPQIHDGHSITDILACGQVMGDKKVGKIKFLFKLHHQLQYHGPDRNICHGNRLIGHYEFRMGHKAAYPPWK